MPHPFFDGSRRLVFAHRGGSGLAPENTLAAFDRAQALGVDGLELDARLSRDGVVVLHHDPLLDRTTNARGPVEALTAAELARVDAGHRFGGPGRWPFRGLGIGVPTLSDVLDRYRDLRIIIELKVDAEPLARAVIDLVRAAGAWERVCLGAFGQRALAAVRTFGPAVATSAARPEVRRALYRSWARWPVSRVPYGGYQVPERLGWTRVVSPRFVADAHRAGLAVQVWTVDRENDAYRLLAWGVDALITDRPDLIAPIVRSAARVPGRFFAPAVEPPTAG